MQIGLELLAPAKNKDIGIAAIGCGADAVYIAGPRFGAREAAGNPLADIAALSSYARKFDARIYLVLNTILYDNELEEARKTLWQAYEAGCDAFIVQDTSLLQMDLPPVPLFASTQTNIRTPEQARFLEAQGFRRLILARELSLDQIREIRRATSVPLESFVHGALCVSYSGQCYLSQYLTGRSANRGRCAQACRADYTLEDSSGKILLQNRPLLSLKDLDLSGRIADLAEAGITSFKIEGRLKNESYIKNIVLHYRRAIDRFLEHHPEYRADSAGECRGGFSSDPALTFNRGYTEFFIDGKRGGWNSRDGAKYIGEAVGTVTNSENERTFRYRLFSGKAPLHNGDGLCFITPSGKMLGARANRCNGNTAELLERADLPAGTRIFRNYNIAFEKEMQSRPPRRTIPVTLVFEEAEADLRYRIAARFRAGSGQEETLIFPLPEAGEPATDPERAESSIRSQLGKTADRFSFRVEKLNCRHIPFYPIAALNALRRELAGKISAYMEDLIKERRKETEIFERRSRAIPETAGDERTEEGPAAATERPPVPVPIPEKGRTYLLNCSNRLAERFYEQKGAGWIDPAYEIRPVPEAELMRTKYCLKYELGLCPKQRPEAQKTDGNGTDAPAYLLRPDFLPARSGKNGKNAFPTGKKDAPEPVRTGPGFKEPLFLINGKTRLRLKFDCEKCEMVIIG